MKIGIDIGGSHVAIGLINENGKIIAKEDKDLNKKMVEELEKSLKEAKEEGDLDKAKRFEKLLDRLK